jgi:hypothetical protein
LFLLFVSDMCNSHHPSTHLTAGSQDPRSLQELGALGPG